MNHRRLHMVSVALGNAGVSLLEHGSYLDAAVTLEDALETITYLGDGCTPSLDSEALMISALDEKIVRASDHLADLVHKPTVVEQEALLPIAVLSENVHPSMLLSEAFGDFYVLRLDQLSYMQVQECDLMSLQRTRAMLLHNYGVAMKCFALQCRSADPVLMLEKAHRAFCYAEEIALHWLHTAPSDLVAAPVVFSRLDHKTMLVLWVVWRSLVQISLELNRMDDCRRYWRKLIELIGKINGLDGHTFSSLVDFTAAAA